ncbi:hypothetical protein K502DRAFT_329840 [Neoconidiobolus thromboides FSU 785]|nr:hypothetical protein K502DRAFT_329840 [Neoconidiobolus thromboides FSU 785]
MDLNTEESQENETKVIKSFMKSITESVEDKNLIIEVELSSELVQSNGVINSVTTNAINIIANTDDISINSHSNWDETGVKKMDYKESIREFSDSEGSWAFTNKRFKLYLLSSLTTMHKSETTDVKIEADIKLVYFNLIFIDNRNKFHVIISKVEDEYIIHNKQELYSLIGSFKAKMDIKEETYEIEEDTMLKLIKDQDSMKIKNIIFEDRK